MNCPGFNCPGFLPDPERGDQADSVATLAADWVTIWQSELAALAADREQAEHAGAILAAWLAATGAMRRHDRGATAQPSRPYATARAAPAAAAPDAGDALAGLERRLAELERRLDAVVAPVPDR